MGQKVSEKIGLGLGLGRVPRYFFTTCPLPRRIRISAWVSAELKAPWLALLCGKQSSTWAPKWKCGVLLVLNQIPNTDEVILPFYEGLDPTHKPRNQEVSGDYNPMPNPMPKPSLYASHPTKRTSEIKKKPHTATNKDDHRPIKEAKAGGRENAVRRRGWAVPLKRKQPELVIANYHTCDGDKSTVQSIHPSVHPPNQPSIYSKLSLPTSPDKSMAAWCAHSGSLPPGQGRGVS